MAELPAPPPGRSGWPWTPKDLTTSRALADGTPKPRISIITPSFNQVDYLEACIRSVLLQGYPDLEYIIMDGGSKDGSIEVIRRYEPWLTYWQSRPDGGQAAAINAGLEKATGSIVAWLNSDDFYLPGALASVASTLKGQRQVAVGNSVYVGSGEAEYVFTPSFHKSFLQVPGAIPQHSTFWTSDLAGRLNIELVCSFDFEYWYRLAKNRVTFISVNRALAGANLHTQQKLTSEAWSRQRHADDRTLAGLHPGIRSVGRSLAFLMRMSQRYKRLRTPKGDPKSVFDALEIDSYRLSPRMLARLEGEAN